jgi:hypothetical protein
MMVMQLGQVVADFIGYFIIFTLPAFVIPQSAHNNFLLFASSLSLRRDVLPPHMYV